MGAANARSVAPSCALPYPDNRPQSPPEQLNPIGLPPRPLIFVVTVRAMGWAGLCQVSDGDGAAVNRFASECGRGGRCDGTLCGPKSNEQPHPGMGMSG